MLRYSISWLVLLGCASTEVPSAAPTQPSSSTAQVVPVRVRARADVDRVSPDQEIQIAFELDVAPGYVVAWQHSGTDHPGTTVRVVAPSGFQVGPMRFEGPKRLASSAPLVYGYDASFVVSHTLTTPATISSSEVAIDATVTWTVCKSSCETAGDDVEITLPVASAGAPSAPRHVEFFRLHESRRPRPWSALANPRHSWLRTDTGYELVLYIDGGVEVEYIPTQSTASNLKGQAVVPGLGVAALHLDFVGDLPSGVTGVVRATDATDTYFFDLDIDAPTGECDSGEVCGTEASAK